MIYRNIVVCALALSLSGAAHAQSPPPPPMPTVPDEPLPEWRPTARRSSAMFMSVAPELVTAQKMRQAGLWISSVGWLQGFLSGILYAAAADVNTAISNPRTTGVDVSGNPIVTRVFDPSGEDKRNNLEKASLSLVIVGGAMAVGGFALFTAGQWRISSYHKRHPKEPLPPLSGF